MTDSRIPTELFERHLAGETTPAEAHDMAAWMQADAAGVGMVNALRDATAPARQDADVQWARLQARMRSQDNTSQVSRRVVRRGREYGRYAVMTATAALVVLAAVVWPRTSTQPMSYVTQRGEFTTVTLPDSSQVTLAPESRLELAGDFGDATRSVVLSGEAFFRIAGSAAAPFQVHTGAITTRVLGTAFGVRRYADDATVRIAVESGKVSSSGMRGHAILAANTVGYITDSTATAIPNADTHRYTAWVDGRLVFDDTPVPEMLVTMGRWYGYTFQLADSTLARRHVTAAFNVQASTETMSELARLLEVTMHRSGNVITLHPRPASSRTRPGQSPRTRTSPFGEPGTQTANTSHQVGR